jgi:hypothetical protein
MAINNSPSPGSSLGGDFSAQIAADRAHLDNLSKMAKSHKSIGDSLLDQVKQSQKIKDIGKDMTNSINSRIKMNQVLLTSEKQREVIGAKLIELIKKAHSGKFLTQKGIQDDIAAAKLQYEQQESKISGLKKALALGQKNFQINKGTQLQLSQQSRHIEHSVALLEKMGVPVKFLAGAFEGIVGLVEDLGLGFGAIFIGLGLIIELLKLAFQRFSDLQKAGEKFRFTTGLIGDASKSWTDQIDTLSVTYSELGLTADKVADSQIALINTYGNANTELQKSVELVGLLNVLQGVSVEDSSKFLKNISSISDMNGDIARDTLLSVQSLAKNKKNIIPYDKIIHDIATASGKTLLYFRGNTKELIKSAIQAREYGTTLDDLSNSADSLLDFQQSITAEQKLSVLAGRNINFQKLREIAFSGNLGDLAKAQNDMARENWDIVTKGKILEKKAYMEASGLTAEGLANVVAQINLQNDLGKTFVDNANDAAKALDKTLDPVTQIQEKMHKAGISQKEYNDLQKQAQVLYAQQRKDLVKNGNAQSDLTKLANDYKSILVSLGTALEPIVKDVVDFLTTHQKGITDGFKTAGVFVHDILKNFTAIRITAEVLIALLTGAALFKFGRWTLNIAKNILGWNKPAKTLVKTLESIDSPLTNATSKGNLLTKAFGGVKSKLTDAVRWMFRMGPAVDSTVGSLSTAEKGAKAVQTEFTFMEDAVNATSTTISGGWITGLKGVLSNALPVAAKFAAFAYLLTTAVDVTMQLYNSMGLIKNEFKSGDNPFENWSNGIDKFKSELTKGILHPMSDLMTMVSKPLFGIDVTKRIDGTLDDIYNLHKGLNYLVTHPDKILGAVKDLRAGRAIGIPRELIHDDDSKPVDPKTPIAPVSAAPSPDPSTITEPSPLSDINSSTSMYFNKLNDTQNDILTQITSLIGLLKAGNIRTGDLYLDTGKLVMGLTDYSKKKTS